MAFLSLVLWVGTGQAQGVFTSAASGNWASSSTWTLSSGSDADGVPDADDDVTIATGHAIRITTGSGVNSDKCNDLSMVGTASVIIEKDRRLDVEGNLTMSGTSSVNGDNSIDNSHVLVVGGTFEVASGATVVISDARFQVNGQTTLNGELGFSDLIGVKTFNGITVNASGNWNNGTVSEAFFINGDIVNNGSWTGCPTGQDNCNYQFSGSAALSGSRFISMPDIVIDASVTVTNNGLLIVSDRITRSEDNMGSATFVNGTNAFLIFNGSNATTPDKFDLSTFTATAPGNSIVFGGNNQDIPVNSGVYQNLVINGADVGLEGDFSIANRLTLTAGDINLGTNTLTIEAGATISGGSSTSYINASGSGVLRRGISATGTYSIPLGGANYSPISINLSAATLGSNPYLDFGITDSAHPNRDTDNTAETPPGDDDGTAATDYLDVYWTVTANDITTPTYSVSYVYDASDFSQSTESNMVGAFYRTLSGGSTRDWLANGIVDASTNTVSLSNLTGFGDFYAMNNTLNRLPVELLYFHAKNDQGRVLLQWATASEENNDYFTLERSPNAREYEVLGYVAGQGSSQKMLRYEFADQAPRAGRSFYRLKQTDFNGTFAYSELVAVEVDGHEAMGKLGVFPNPVQRGEIIHTEPAMKSPAQWRLISMSGAALGHGNGGLMNADLTMRVPESCQPGLYLLELVTSSGRWVKRIQVK